MIHSVTVNIGKFGFWRVDAEFIINVQDDSNDDERYSNLSSSMESDSELAQQL
jgi:hypothetical protein